jgi:hypothetical protein
MSNLAPEKLHEKLLGYLLDACDADERQQIEQHLQQDESLRQRCDLLNKAFDPLAHDKAHIEPPKGLAVRCCEYVFSRADVMPAALSPVGGSAALPVKRRRWSWLDVTVATAVAAAVMFLIGPAIFQARQQAIKMTCQGNLKNFGEALASYSDRHGGLYPAPTARGGGAAYAGMWGPLLKDHQPHSGELSCPSAAAACRTKSPLPKFDALDALTDQQYEAIAPLLARGFGVTFGYIKDGKYHVHTNTRRAHFVVASDAPGPGQSNSPNHGGTGQNVVREDGSTAFLIHHRPETSDDDFFLNANNTVGPGTHSEDSVIFPMHYRIRVVIHLR